MKTIVPIGIGVCRSLCAVMMGPMVLVCKWKANSSNDLLESQPPTLTIEKKAASTEDIHNKLKSVEPRGRFELWQEHLDVQFSSSLQMLAGNLLRPQHVGVRTLGYLRTPALITQ